MYINEGDFGTVGCLWEGRQEVLVTLRRLTGGGWRQKRTKVEKKSEPRQTGSTQ